MSFTKLEFPVEIRDVLHHVIEGDTECSSEQCLDYVSQEP